MAPCKARSHWNLRIWTGFLVAGDRFSGLFGGLRVGRSTVAARMAVAIPITITIRWSNANRLSRLLEICSHRLRDVAERSDLHHRPVSLRQHLLLVDRAH